MKNRLLLTLFLVGILLAANSCESDDPSPEKKSNPFEIEVGWNGFVMDGGEYETPNAIIEEWGKTDSMSADYDISFTDGSFNSSVREVTGHTILVYFDVNSPSLSELSTGEYYFDNSDPARLPNKIGEAYIMISSETSVIKYPIIEGTVEVSAQDGYFLIEYLLKSVKDQKIVDVAGQYTGVFQFIDQQIKN